METLKIALYSTTVFEANPDTDRYNGLEKIVGLLAKRFEELGHHVDLFAPMGSYVPKNGGKLYASGQPGQFDEYTAFDNYWAVEESRNALKNADIVHDHSIAGDEEIYIKKDGKIQRKTLEQFANMHDLEPITDTTEASDVKKTEVMTVTDDLKVTWKPIKKVFRHRNSEVYQLKTERGYWIKATGNHSLFTLDDKGTLKEISVKDAIGKNIAILRVPRFDINELSEIYPKPIGSLIWGSWVSDYISKNKERLLQKEMKDGLIKEHAQRKIHRWMKEAYIPTDRHEEPISLPCELSGSPNSAGYRLKLPIKLTHELMMFFGLWIGDGCYNTNSVRISSNEAKPVIYELCKQLGLNFSEFGDRPDINTDILGEIFKRAMLSLGFKGHADTKRVPEWIFTLDRNLVGSFISGMILADGCVDEIGGAERIRYSTINYGLAMDFRMLNQLIGKDVSIYLLHPNGETYIDGKKIIRGDIYECHIRNNTEVGGTGDIPTISFLTEQGNKKEQRCRSEKTKIKKVERLTAGTLFEYLGKSEVSFAKVNEVKLIEGYEFVYDLEVEETNRFIASGVVAHNSWMYCPYLQAKELKALCHTHHGPDPGFQVKPPVDKPNLMAVSPNHAKKLMQYQWSNPDGTLQPPMDCVWRGVNNGIDVEKYPFTKEKGDYFLWVGRLFPFKAPHRFIDICDKMQVPGKIVGGSFGQDPGYVSLIKQKLAASKYVTCVGEPGVSVPTKKIIELYMGAKAVVQPSVEYLPLSNGKGYAKFIEPYGLIIAEANACGTPVVVTPSGGWQSTLRHGVNGFFANSDEEFIYYLRRINEIKAEDCRAVAELFSYKVMGEEYLKLYKEICYNNGSW